MKQIPKNFRNFADRLKNVWIHWKKQNLHFLYKHMIPHQYKSSPPNIWILVLPNQDLATPSSTISDVDSMSSLDTGTSYVTPKMAKMSIGRGRG